MLSAVFMVHIPTDDTIAAIATPLGEGGISVLRLSGPESFSILKSIFHPKNPTRFEAFETHTIHFGKIENQGQVYDEVLISIFKKHHSYTGEDLIEISAHGGMVLTRRILALLLEKGARPAEPGEFTKRAFLNGKIDLTQAEAVLDLIKSKSEKSLESAVSQLQGALSRRFQTLKNSMMKIYAHMEAFLDFPDEDLEIFEDSQFRHQLSEVEKELEQLIQSFKRGALFREGVSIAIVGRPNAGKSSLFNTLLARDRALVSEHPGTTRDVLEETIEIQGISIRLMDTAGLSQTLTHPLDQMGVQRTREVLGFADFYLYLIDGSVTLTREDHEAFHSIPNQKPILVLITKSDLPRQWKSQALQNFFPNAQALEVSTKTRKGIDALENKIADSLLGGTPAGDGEQITRLRHKQALDLSRLAWQKAIESFERRESLEIVILDLKAAIDHLRELIGEIYSEDLLDVIFSEFCIGK